MDSLVTGIHGYREDEMKRLLAARQTENGGTTGHYGDDAEAYRSDARNYYMVK